MADGAFNPPAEEESSAPHNIDAEQAFLGALLYDNAVLEETPYIGAEHFYDPLHGRIFDAARALIAQGRQADAVTLKSHFEADAGLKEIGGPIYLVDLMREAPDPVTAPEYGRLVVDLAVRRALIAASMEMSREAREAEADATAADLLTAAESKLAALSETTAGPVSFSEPETGIDAVWRAAEEARENGKPPGLMTGYSAIDRQTGGLFGGDLVILAGRPAMGKTLVAENIARRSAQAGRRVGFMSLEMSRGQLWQRAIVAEAARAGAMATIQTLRDGDWYSEADRTKTYEAAERLKGDIRGRFVVDDRSGLTVAEIARSARQMRRRMGGLDILVIDYLQLIEGERRRRDDSRVQEITQITMALKALAKALDIPIIALSQLSRQVEQRADKRPMLSDLRESGSIEQDADTVIFAYREAYYLEREEPKANTEEYDRWFAEMNEVRHDIELIFAKQRQGPIGTARMKIIPDAMRLEDRAA